MFGSTVFVPILFGVDPATILLMNGIGTLLYLWICKGRIPAYLGSSFAFISPVLVVLSGGSYETALGGFIAAGIIFSAVAVIVRFAGTRWIDIVFPPAAMGAIVAVIGLELVPAAVMRAVSLLLFGILAASGIRMLVECKVDYSQSSNIILTTVVLVIGLSGASVNLGYLQLKGIGLATVVAIVLSLLIWGLKKINWLKEA